MNKAIVEPGQQYGRLTVIEFVGKKGSHKIFLCQCECGNTRTVLSYKLTTGNVKSCGCLRSETARQKALARNKQMQKHGEASDGKVTALYRCWQNMRRRCTYPKSINYEYYGGRGIKVCDRWQTFENFRDDMGPHPGSNFTLDRINVDGNYEPSNCRWATRSEQQHNQKEKTCEFCGKTFSRGADLSLHMKVHRGTL